VEIPLVRILVVVANIQVRSLRLKWIMVPLEEQFAMGESFLSVAAKVVST